MIAVRDEQFATRMFEVAADLLSEFEDLPITAIVSALAAARRELTDPEGHLPRPELIAAAARERLAHQRHAVRGEPGRVPL